MGNKDDVGQFLQYGLPLAKKNLLEAIYKSKAAVITVWLACKKFFNIFKPDVYASYSYYMKCNINNTNLSFFILYQYMFQVTTHHIIGVLVLHIFSWHVQ